MGLAKGTRLGHYEVLELTRQGRHGRGLPRLRHAAQARRGLEGAAERGVQAMKYTRRAFLKTAAAAGAAVGLSERADLPSLAISPDRKNILYVTVQGNQSPDRKGGDTQSEHSRSIPFLRILPNKE
jgi:TAT (twin-arginine translocation) pathway-exported protein